MLRLGVCWFIVCLCLDFGFAGLALFPVWLFGDVRLVLSLVWISTVNWCFVLTSAMVRLTLRFRVWWCGLFLWVASGVVFVLVYLLMGFGRGYVGWVMIWSLTVGWFWFVFVGVCLMFGGWL